MKAATIHFDAPAPWSETVYAIGNFDGVHRGHSALLKSVITYAHEHHLHPGVLTFHPHPRDFLLHASPQPRLTPLEEKFALFKAAGIQHCGVLPFNTTMAALSPEDFVEYILVERCFARHLIVGENFAFGAQRKGTTATLLALGEALHLDVTIAPLFLDESQIPISSRRVIDALKIGDIPLATRLLGRPYSIRGTVIPGARRGREIGFPTANLLPTFYVTPLRGVYAVSCVFDNTRHSGIANIGIRPTFKGTQELLEVHIFNFSHEIYGKTLTIHFHEFLRPERTFATVPALKEQIHRDVLLAQQCSSL